MNDPLRLHSESLRVPFVPKATEGVLGDGVHDIDPEHPEFAAWNKWMTQNGLGPDEKFRYGVDDPDVSLPPGITARHDSKEYAGGIVTYDRKIPRVQSAQFGLVPISPEHHESAVITEMVEHWGGVEKFMKEWDGLSRADQNQLLRRIGDQTGETIWTLKHELQKMGG